MHFKLRFKKKNNNALYIIDFALAQLNLFTSFYIKNNIHVNQTNNIYIIIISHNPNISIQLK